MSFTLGSTNTNQQQQQPTTGFGTFGLGSTSLTANKPTFGSSMLNTTTNLFGNTAQTTQNTNTSGLFGSTSTTGLGTAGTSGGLFGNTTSLGTTGFGTSNLTTSQPSTAFGSNTQSTGLSTGFNLGGSTSLFGQKPATAQPTSMFSFSTPSFNQPAQSNLLNLNPQQQQQQQQAQQQQQQQQQHNDIDPLTFTPKLFNDEQDRILGEFNKLQAYWGFGKGYYAYNKPPTEFNQNQPLHKFKSIGFAEIKQASDDDENKFGVLVKMESEQQLNTSILQYEANLKSMFGMNNSFNVKVENCKQLPENKALLCISVVDTNTNKKLPAFQLISFLNQAHIKQQLNNAFVNMFIELVPLQPPSKQEIEDYLKVPPAGIDATLWAQAKKENPDPKKFIPVPFIGFGALNSRFKYQVQETEQQRLRLQIISDDINNLEGDIAQMKAKLEECKRRNVTLGNRVLKTMIWQEIKRKKGFPILAEEDELRMKLMSIQNELSAPTKYKGCLNELICKLRHMQSQKQVNHNFAIDDNLMKELQVHLNEEQQGIEHLLTLVKNDLKDLKAIKTNLK